jgi:hypothetical protein
VILAEGYSWITELCRGSKKSVGRSNAVVREYGPSSTTSGKWAQFFENKYSNNKASVKAANFVAVLAVTSSEVSKRKEMTLKSYLIGSQVKRL